MGSASQDTALDAPSAPHRRPLIGLHQLPNTICVARVIVVFAGVYEIGRQHATQGTWAWGWLVAIILAALSDRLDGFLAKRYGWTSRLGAFLDQISDKLVTLAIYAFLSIIGAFPLLALAAIVLRELFVSALRIAANQVRVPIPTGESGRFKTFVQQTAALPIFLHFVWPEAWLFGFTFAQWLMWVGWTIFLIVVLAYGRRAVRAFVRVYRVDRKTADGRVETSWVDLALVVITLAAIPLPVSIAGPVTVLTITLGTGVTYLTGFRWSARLRGARWLGGTAFTLGVSLITTSGLALILLGEPNLLAMWLVIGAVSLLWTMLLAASAKTGRRYLGG